MEISEILDVSFESYAMINESDLYSSQSKSINDTIEFANFAINVISTESVTGGDKTRYSSFADKIRFGAKKIWEFLKKAFEKIRDAIVGFVNKLRSKGLIRKLKSQSKWFESKRKVLPILYDEYKRKVMVLPPKVRMPFKDAMIFIQNLIVESVDEIKSSIEMATRASTVEEVENFLRKKEAEYVKIVGKQKVETSKMQDVASWILGKVFKKSSDNLVNRRIDEQLKKTIYSLLQDSGWIGARAAVLFEELLYGEGTYKVEERIIESVLPSIESFEVLSHQHTNDFIIIVNRMDEVARESKNTLQVLESKMKKSLPDDVTLILSRLFTSTQELMSTCVKVSTGMVGQFCSYRSYITNVIHLFLHQADKDNFGG